MEAASWRIREGLRSADRAACMMMDSLALEDEDQDYSTPKG